MVLEHIIRPKHIEMKAKQYSMQISGPGGTYSILPVQVDLPYFFALVPEERRNGSLYSLLETHLPDEVRLPKGKNKREFVSAGDACIITHCSCCHPSIDSCVQFHIVRTWEDDDRSPLSYKLPEKGMVRPYEYVHIPFAVFEKSNIAFSLIERI